MTGYNRFPLNLVERLGLTHLSQATLVSMTALSLVALGLSISQTLLQDNVYAHSSAQLTQQLPSADLELVNQAQLFGAPGKGPAVDSDELPLTQLQWVLQGVFTGTSPESGSAIILAGDQKRNCIRPASNSPVVQSWPKCTPIMWLSSSAAAWKPCVFPPSAPSHKPLTQASHHLSR